MEVLHKHGSEAQKRQWLLAMAETAPRKQTLQHNDR